MRGRARIARRVFACEWHGSPSLPPDGTTGGCTVLAYAGGGGSARTGVFNSLVLSTATQAAPGEDGVVRCEYKIDTGEQIGVGVAIHRDHGAGGLAPARMAAAVGDEVRVYAVPVDPDSVPEGEGGAVEAALRLGTVNVGKGFGCNTVAWSPQGDAIAVGCENGRVLTFAVRPSDGGEGVTLSKRADCVGHEKAVCAVVYHPRGGAVLSSAKDGTARIWNVRAEGGQMALLKCSIEDPSGSLPPKNKRPPQVLVRGCAFGDLEGKIAYTVASGRKGSAYLSKWLVTPERRGPPQPMPGKPPLSARKGAKDGRETLLKVSEEKRVKCHPMPVSAVSLSGDASHLALGGVDGTVSYFNVEMMRPTKKWIEIHDLPVTCIAARPTPLPLPGDEEEGIAVDVMSASADNRLSKLTLQRRNRKRKRGGGSGGVVSGMARMVGVACSRPSLFIFWVGALLALLAQMSRDVCEAEISSKDLQRIGECVWHTVLWASPDRPGVSFPPH